MEHRHEHDRGLAYDLATLMGQQERMAGLGVRPAGLLDRRFALRLFAGAGLVALVGCGSDKQAAGPTPTAAARSSAPQATAGTDGDCSRIPEETAGPYPGDGSNGPDILTQSGVVRSDIRSSIGSAAGTAAGVPLRVELTVVDASSNCATLAGAAVYLWHCDRDGQYSMYGAAQHENYLRGLQAAGADGIVKFTSIFPAAYSGRWPHIHFEVYPSLTGATSAANRTATSQLALPAEACQAVFATTGYEQSVRNLSQSSLSSDNVFRDDGAARQLATISGSVGRGFVARLTVPV